jgi:hypothetical protein
MQFPRVVIPHRGPRVGVTGSDLHVTQVSASVEHGRDIGVTEHVRVRPGDLDASGSGEVPQAASGRMAIHPAAAAVEQNRPAGTQAYRPVDGPADRWWQRNQDDLGALAAHAQHPVAVLLAEVAMFALVALKIRKPSRPSMATSAKSHGLADSRAAVSRASNYRWGHPRVGDSAGTAGRRTCSAGECSMRPSSTQVR